METPERDPQESLQERRIGPSVSKEKWLNYAKAKMSRGYVLIVGNERRTANFYREGKGYEMCAYNVAMQLVRDGSVVKAYDHYLGTAYALKEVPAEEPKPRTRSKPVEEEPVLDVEVLLDDLTGDDDDEEEEAAEGDE